MSCHNGSRAHSREPSGDPGASAVAPVAPVTSGAAAGHRRDAGAGHASLTTRTAAGAAGAATTLRHVAGLRRRGAANPAARSGPAPALRHGGHPGAPRTAATFRGHRRQPVQDHAERPKRTMQEHLQDMGVPNGVGAARRRRRQRRHRRRPPCRSRRRSPNYQRINSCRMSHTIAWWRCIAQTRKVNHP